MGNVKHTDDGSKIYQGYGLGVLPAILGVEGKIEGAIQMKYEGLVNNGRFVELLKHVYQIPGVHLEIGATKKITRHTDCKVYLYKDGGCKSIW